MCYGLRLREPRAFRGHETASGAYGGVASRSSTPALLHAAMMALNRRFSSPRPPRVSCAGRRDRGSEQVDCLRSNHYRPPEEVGRLYLPPLGGKSEIQEVREVEEIEGLATSTSSTSETSPHIDPHNKTKRCSIAQSPTPTLPPLRMLLLRFSPPKTARGGLRFESTAFSNAHHALQRRASGDGCALPRRPFGGRAACTDTLLM